MVYLLIGISTEAAPRAQSDLILLRLFHAFAGVGTFVNRLPSSAKTLPPYLHFTQAIPLDHGMSHLQGECSLRSVSKSSVNSSYFNQILDTAPAQTLNADSNYVFQAVHVRDQSFTAIFKNEKETPSVIEISCTHPQVNEWTVSHFESELSGSAELRVYPESTPKKAMTPMAVSMIHGKDFQGSWANGLFGSGLPGPGGPLPGGPPPGSGKHCTLIAQETAALDSSYVKDSRFAFLGYKVSAPNHAVELVFDNWNYSPHQIRIQCTGLESEVLAMNSGEIERDLNGAVHFYQK